MLLHPLDPAVVSRLSIAFWACMIERGVTAWDERQRSLSSSRRPPPRPASAGTLVTVDKLWQEVVQNLLKGCGGQRSTALASSELRLVLDDAKKAQPQRRPGTAAAPVATGGVSEGQSSAAAAVAAAFSCGHVLSADGLALVAVPELRHALASAGVPPASCALLADAYRPDRLQPGRRFELACPACVARAVVR